MEGRKERDGEKRVSRGNETQGKETHFITGKGKRENNQLCKILYPAIELLSLPFPYSEDVLMLHSRSCCCCENGIRSVIFSVTCVPSRKTNYEKCDSRQRLDRNELKKEKEVVE